MSQINTLNLDLGVNSVFDSTAVIRGINGPAKRIKIDDNSYIGANVQIICDDIELSDSIKNQNNTSVHSYKPCKTGHNAWIGQFSIIDSIAGVTIGDNCGIDANSQLWSDIKFGDMLEGCRFLSDSPLTMGIDMWFVSHCTFSPITEKDKSMALVGSVVTKDMEENYIYTGSSAKNISDKAGHQFNPVPKEEKLARMLQYLIEWDGNQESIRIVRSFEEVNLEEGELTYFNVSERKYSKRSSEEEVSFITYLLPEKAKFTSH